ncbi:hypothetical protein [Methanolacinia paynteri]|uniref:hypothetical protein n=1 Tax=Methanolacinia paynteri TaxID=230356 RepID=UPI0012F6BA36|nr:hypothetical protein [Methanolacinia paynteri]
MEWIFRFAILVLLCVVLSYVAVPENYYAILVVYWGQIIGIILLFGVQFYNIWIFWKDGKKDK